MRSDLTRALVKYPRFTIRPYVVSLLLFVILAGGCENPAGPAMGGQWRFLGLGGESVYLLKTRGNELYAGTRNGIFRMQIGSSDTVWTAIGLQGRRVDALLVLDSETLLASVRISGTGADTISLYRTTDGGWTWTPYQNGFGAGEGSNQVRGLARVNGHGILASGGGAVVAKSTDDGESWRKVWGDWWLGALSTFVETDPHWPNLAWGGGESGFMQPFLLKSRDGGENWDDIRVNVGGDNAHYSLAIDPTDSAHVFTGMEGRILRTRNDGKDWETILSPSSYPYFFGLAVSSRDPRRVYAAGAINTPEPQPLLLYVSSDAGATWSTILHESAEYGGALSLLLVEEAERETVYLGTEEGVYAYGLD